MDQVTEEEVIQACKDANIYDFVMSLPQGLDTEVGGKGSQLSGGQVSRADQSSPLTSNSERRANMGPETTYRYRSSTH